MDPVLESYYALEEKVKQYNPNLDTKRLFAAFQYADNAHSGQLRKDGSPFVTHPLAVAEIVAELELDTDSIIAALLHDCIEDTGSTHEEIAKLFGPAVADLVEGVTKLTRVQYTSKEEEQMENLRKMLMAMAKDIRVILIKICDRLHNMRTMNYQSARKQREKALETMEIYAPIAHRLGMQKIKWELEDLSLQYLDPVGYQGDQRRAAPPLSAHEEFMAGIQKKIKDRLAEEGIKATVYGRVKHIYSIYRKMFAQNKTLDEIFDLYAFRVIVDDIPECYNVLGCIHDLFKPVLGRFKDYIGTPKPNGYQSLHTTVIGREGIPFEVQIRTWEMHHTAEYGIAAHWKYRSPGPCQRQTGHRGGLRVGPQAAGKSAGHRRGGVRPHPQGGHVRRRGVRLHPRGDVVNLPAGDTPIDFAYSIHSAVGNAMTGAKVNGRIVTFDYQLQSGGHCGGYHLQIRPRPQPGLDEDLQVQRGAGTRSSSGSRRSAGRRTSSPGRSMFESELKRTGISLAAITSEEVLPHLLKRWAPAPWTICTPPSATAA
ncbi:MAG: RelA/SpoT family protein [Intestinimonas sp.]